MLRTRKMAFRLHWNGDRREIKPIVNGNLGLVEHSELIVLISEGIGEFDDGVAKILRDLVYVETVVAVNWISPIKRAVQLKKFIRRAPNVVIYCLELEIVEVQGKRSLDERTVVEGNKDDRFFALSEALNVANKGGVVANSRSTIEHCKLRPPDRLLQVESDCSQFLLSSTPVSVSFFKGSEFLKYLFHWSIVRSVPELRN